MAEAGEGLRKVDRGDLLAADPEVKSFTRRQRIVFQGMASW
jgi:hypothetical protein